MSILAGVLRLGRQVFLNTAVALILFFLPIDVLFRISSWILYMPVLDMVSQVMMMVVLLVFVSASLAILVAGAGLVLISLPLRESAEKIEETIRAVVAIGSLAFITLLLLKMLKTWLQLVTGSIIIVGTPKVLVPLLVIGVCAIAARKYGLKTWGNAIQSRLAKGNKVVLILVLVAGLVVGAKGIDLHDYNEIKTNAIPLSRAETPNVILLSIDTLSAEDMSLHGYHLPTTPRLETFAKESYVFDNYFSSSNWTTPSMAAFISGLHPVSSGVHHYGSYFLEVDRKKNLGQALRDNGYQTAAIVANGNGHPIVLQISDSFSATTEPPVDRSFAEELIFEELFRVTNYRTYLWAEALLLPVFQILDVFSDEDTSLWPPELVFNRTLPFLTMLKQPSFIWTHVMPPHSPYLPAVPFKYKFGNFKEFSTKKEFERYLGEYSPEQQSKVDQQRLRYDEFILDTDAEVGDFLDKLRALGRFDDSIIIVTSDHGESFTRNYVQHGGPYLHQPLIHVPLLVHLPGQKEGKRIPFYAGQVDLLPTVMDLLNLPIPKWVDGESLKSAILEGKPTSLPKFSMNLDQDSRFEPPSKGTVAVMQGGWKLVRYLATGKEELYHLESDPAEAFDLSGSNSEQARAMRNLIYTRFKLTQ